MESVGENMRLDKNKVDGGRSGGVDGGRGGGGYVVDRWPESGRTF